MHFAGGGEPGWGGGIVRRPAKRHRRRRHRRCRAAAAAACELRRAARLSASRGIWVRRGTALGAAGAATAFAASAVAFPSSPCGSGSSRVEEWGVGLLFGGKKGEGATRRESVVSMVMELKVQEI